MKRCSNGISNEHHDRSKCQYPRYILTQCYFLLNRPRLDTLACRLAVPFAILDLCYPLFGSALEILRMVPALMKPFLGRQYWILRKIVQPSRTRKSMVGVAIARQFVHL